MDGVVGEVEEADKEETEETTEVEGREDEISAETSFEAVVPDVFPSSSSPSFGGRVHVLKEESEEEEEVV